MSDEWQLQQSYSRGWRSLGGEWAGDDVSRMSGGLRWWHPDGQTQPARTDEDGRLLGPVDLDAVLDQMRDGGVDVADEWLTTEMVEQMHEMLDKGESIIVWRDGSLRVRQDERALGPDTAESLRAEIRQQAEEIAARGGGLRELVGKWPGDEPCLRVGRRCGFCGAPKRLVDVGCSECELPAAGAVTMGGESTYGDDEPYHPFTVISKALGYGQQDAQPDPHIRAQLVDGLPGAWVHEPYDQNDDTRAWILHFCGIEYRAVIDIDTLRGVAAGWVEMADGNVGLADSTVYAEVSEYGDEFVMVCARRLAEKVDAVREMVGRLKG